MMPEGPEVRTVVDQLQDAVGQRLIDWKFVSGRYRKEIPQGWNAFEDRLLKTGGATITKFRCKGKFIYITLESLEGDEDSGYDQDSKDPSVWITLGMTGKFMSETAHANTAPDNKEPRWYFEVESDEKKKTRIYYYDRRNFGTVRFSFSKVDLTEKVDRLLGPDILESTVEDLVDVFRKQPARSRKVNICRFLMNQEKIAGVGNYLLSEVLYRANISPFITLSQLSSEEVESLCIEIVDTARASYEKQGVTRPGGSYRTVEGEMGSFAFELLCYGRKRCGIRGDEVIQDTNGPHGRTIWYTARQLGDNQQEIKQTETKLRPRATSYSYVRQPPQTLDTKPVHLLNFLSSEGWKQALGSTLQSASFLALQSFLNSEYQSGATIYPPRHEIFAALNLCPLKDVRVVVVGQDPYHGVNQGHGLAFSVRKGVSIPPSLRNIFRELNNDLGIRIPSHGCLERWAEQGVLLLNTVLTVREGKANSHAKKGWEEFTDAVLRSVNDQEKSVVFMLWGSPAQKKAELVDEERHYVIRTSHPSPLGATKTASPFLGSKCFSKANEVLEIMELEAIDWALP